MKIVFALMLSICIITGCSSNGDTNDVAAGELTTKERVYNEDWDGEPVIVEKQTENGEYEDINEINDAAEIETIIETLRNAEWKENVHVDIRPPDYRFSWNSYNHSVWHNQVSNRLELLIVGQANYGTLSEQDSEIIYEILTGNELESEY